MSSKSKEVSGRILQKNPKALYVHCSSHCLNLVVAKACKLSAAKQMFGVAQKLSSFFSSSCIRTQFLKKKMAKFGSKRRKLKSPSKRRWVEPIYFTMNVLLDDPVILLPILYYEHNN